MPEELIPFGTVTFVFTDIEGSTKLWDAYPETMRVSLARHDAILRQSIEDAHGYVFKTIGDAFCAAFMTAPQAVKAVLDAQMMLEAEPWPEETPIKVRMAVHTGAVESRDRDYFGPPVNRVARLLSTAHGGQIVLSQTCFELSRDLLPNLVRCKDLGFHQLKDLARPEQVFQLMHPAIRSEFPPLRSISDQPNNLPLQLTSFIGRDEEIERVKVLLDKNRLVTLTGSGGAGKTRLGIQIGAEVLDNFADGVWLVELASVTEDRGVLLTIAEVLSVPDQGENSLDSALLERIRDKALLIVLDNCEHLIAECARVSDLLLRSCPSLKILAASRESLGIVGEATMRVPPLKLPAQNSVHTAESLSHYASARLFIDRALLADSNFAVTNSNAPALASICCQLDGIPLAVELAAARVRALSLEQIAARLDQRFSLLTGGSRVALPRQKTLRALIDWSYDLLLPNEKLVFQRLSVFLGGWTLEAAESICSDTNLEPWEVSDTVMALVDKSLVNLQEHESQNRFFFLESIREYSHELLEASGDLVVLQQRHFHFFADLVRATAPKLRGPDQSHWVKHLDSESDNVRASLKHGLGTNIGLNLATHLYWFWYLKGRLTEGRFWLERYMEQTADAEPRILAEALDAFGVYAECQGDYKVALESHGKSLLISRELGERWNEARTLNNIGNVYATQNDYDSAETYWHQGLAIWDALDLEGNLPNRLGPAAAVDNLGNVARSRGNYDEAQDFYLRALDMRRQVGDSSLTASSLLNLGFLAIQTKDREQAKSYMREGLMLTADIGFRVEFAYFMLGVSALSSPNTASLLLGQFEHARDEIGFPMGPEEVALAIEIKGEATRHMPLKEFESLCTSGRSMSPTQAIELALETCNSVG